MRRSTGRLRIPGVCLAAERHSRTVVEPKQKCSFRIGHLHLETQGTEILEGTRERRAMNLSNCSAPAASEQEKFSPRSTADTALEILEISRHSRTAPLDIGVSRHSSKPSETEPKLASKVASRQSQFSFSSGRHPAESLQRSHALTSSADGFHVACAGMLRLQ